MGNAGNPDFLNHLKNTVNDFSIQKLQTAVQSLRDVLDGDLPLIFQRLGFDRLTVCTVPRAKAEASYRPNQQLFRATIREAIAEYGGVDDGTNYLLRHTNTKTTHLGDRVQNNDGDMPYPSITEKTCYVSPDAKGKNILLVDDIYPPGVNIDEDAINAVLRAGAQTVAFYVVAKV